MKLVLPRRKLLAAAAASLAAPAIIRAQDMMLIGAGSPAKVAAGTPATSWDPSNKAASITLTNSNLTVTDSASGFSSVRAFASHSSGKFYYELLLQSLAGSDDFIMGIVNGSFNATGASFVGQTSDGISTDDAGNFFINGAVVGSSFTYANGDVAGIAIDIAGQVFSVNKNGGSFATHSTSTVNAGPYFPCQSLGAPASSNTARFSSASWTGSPPAGGYVQW